MKFLPSFGSSSILEKEKVMRPQHHATRDGPTKSCTYRSMGKKSMRFYNTTENHFLTHVDRLGLEEMRESLISGGKRGVRMETPLGESIENVYDGIHDGRVLGSGVSGMVRVVTHRKTGVEYAVKIIDLSKYSNEKRLAQLKTEVRIAAQVDHPNIIRLEEVYQSETHLYLVQELCTGGDLFDLLKSRKKGHLSEDDTRRLIKELLSAVKYLHAHHILHRDIKLENFLLTSTDFKTASLKMIDFGVAVYFRPGQVHHDAVGTPYVIAPEVIRRCHSESSDVWSVGVLSFALLSGKTPFGGCDGGSLQAVRNNILQGNFSFNDHVWSTVSSAAKNFVLKLLQTDAHKRPSAKYALRHEWIKQRPAIKLVVTTKSQIVPATNRISSFQTVRVHPVLSV